MEGLEDLRGIILRITYRFTGQKLYLMRLGLAPSRENCWEVVARSLATSR